MRRQALNPILGVASSLALLTLAPGSCAAQEAPWPGQQEALSKQLLTALDAFDRGGRWKDTDSAILGWSCGQQLQALDCLYEATGQRIWLDRLFKYAGTMFSNLTTNRDGFLSWRSRRYSSAFARVQPLATNKSKAAMAPQEQWISDTTIGRQVPDGELRLIAQKDAKLTVESGAGQQRLPAISFEVNKPFTGPFAIQLTLSAAPEDGDTFLLTTRQPKDFDMAVHDGMVLMPLCRAIELVRKDEALAAAFGPQATDLLRVIETQLIPKWEQYWRDTKDGGVYVYPDDPAFEPRNATMPHNQYLPLGTVQIALYRITGQARYKDRAAKMASFFRSRLKLVNDHYQWRYWDDAGPWDQTLLKRDKSAARAEDTGHGSLDIGFVLACAENSIVFTDADLRRFAATFAQVMWNGSLEEPAVGGWVNRNEPSNQSGNLQEWLLLGKVEPRVRQICERLIPAKGSLWAKAQLYWLWAMEQRTRR